MLSNYVGNTGRHSMPSNAHKYNQHLSSLGVLQGMGMAGLASSCNRLESWDLFLSIIPVRTFKERH